MIRYILLEDCIILCPEKQSVKKDDVFCLDILSKNDETKFWKLRLYLKDGSSIEGEVLAGILPIVGLKNFDNLFDGRFNLQH